MDIRDLWREESRLSPRYVLMLVEHLPEGSAFLAARRGGPEHQAWDTTAHLLAGIANILNAANYQRAGKRSGKPAVTPPQPKIKSRKRTLSVAQIMSRAARALTSPGGEQ